ncbi:MAG: prolyl-tRNA synthetase associated domain-containing protein [Pseudomonadota bacterium]
MITSPEDLFAWLDSRGIAHSTHWHEATFTVAEGRALKAAMPGGHTKNLFMTNKDGDLILIAAHADSDLPLNKLHRALGVKRLSFGKPALMEEVLGVSPGSVTAFALINDPEGNVRFVVDEALTAFDPVNFHPLVNTGTTAISQADFRRLAELTGHGWEVIDFACLE